MFNFMWPLLAALMVGGYSLNTASTNAGQSPEALATRSYFYVGGEYVNDGLFAHLFRDQMYVESLVPQGGATQKYPIIFVHGTAQTGTNWLNTPDGRQGWASWFLQKGYAIYLIDQPHQGRSGFIPGDDVLTTFSAEIIMMLFTAVQNLKLWPQAILHTQWPGTGIKGDPVFDAFYASQVAYPNDTETVQVNNQRAGAALLDRIGPAIIVTHSQGGPLGFLVADARPSLVKALISLEPQGPPFEDRITTNSTAVVRPYGLTTIPITYDPPVMDLAVDLPRVTIPPAGPNLTECVRQADPPKKLSNLVNIPQLVVTTEASYHAPFDYCTVDYLKQAGVNVDFLDLPKEGIHGNAHLLFMEKNNLDIAAKVEAWIRSQNQSQFVAQEV